MSPQRLWARAQSKYYRTCAEHLHRRTFDVRPETPLISFTFDDFPRTALSGGGDILLRHGVRGTYYVSLGLQDKQEASGTMFTAADLAETRRQGHELGCHTYAHCDSSATEPGRFLQSVQDNQAALSALWPCDVFRTFSYPISTPRPRSKQGVGSRFETCRAGGQTFNAGPSDLNYLRAFFIEKTRGDFAPIQRMIDANRDARGWLIFATHDVCGQPSPYGCTPELFEATVQYSLASGARVLPVSQALDLLKHK